MNSFGRLFRLNIFGESHGEAVGIVLDGVPPGIKLSAADFETDLTRRRGGAKGTTPRVEDDEPKFISGLFNKHTTGAPLTILFENKNIRSTDYGLTSAMPRPGHADFVAKQKYNGFNDPNGGGHFSGRLTVCLVAAGVVAKKIVAAQNAKIKIEAKLIELAGEADVEVGLQKAIVAKDSVGGIVQCISTNVPIGLGEPFFDSFESVLSHLLFSIPAIKGVQFGAGFGAARMFGSQHNDAIISKEGTTSTNYAGGINGGITNGNEIVVQLSVKPASSTPIAQYSFNFEQNKMTEFSVKGRHDLAIALRVPVVAEAAMAIVLADFLLIKKAIYEH